MLPEYLKEAALRPFSLKVWHLAVADIAPGMDRHCLPYSNSIRSIFPINLRYNLGFSFANASFSGSKLWDRSAVEGGVNYTNISPFLKLANANYDFYDAPEGVDGNIRFVAKSGEKGLFKVMALSSKIKGGIHLPDPFVPGEVIPFSTDNENHYSNISYRLLSDKWSLFTAASGSYNVEKFGFGDIPSQNDDWRINWRGEAGFYPSEKFRWLVGSEIQRYALKNSYDIYKSGHSMKRWRLCMLKESGGHLMPLPSKPGLRYERSQDSS